MFKSLLLAVDVNAPEGAVRSAEAAISMARAEGATLHLLNVVPDPGMAIVGASIGSLFAVMISYGPLLYTSANYSGGGANIGAGLLMLAAPVLFPVTMVVGGFAGLCMGNAKIDSSTR